ncbi:MAG: hypothetical protein CMJ18_16675 [Phycisphaeraceae bacterium]|nr:hypothetical protein [Phycisphaeraceae bacterium]
MSTDRKRSAWLLAAAVGVLLCPGLSPSTAADDREPVTLRLRHIPFKDRTDPLSIAKRRVFEAFCRAHPHIRARGPRLMAIEGAGRGGREFLAIAGGVGPDVYHQSGRRLGDYLAQGFAWPLDDYLAAHERETDRPYVGIDAPAIIWEPCQYERRVYGVPYLYYSLALMCRRDIFARGGVDLQPPRDWDEMYHVARRLTFLPDRDPDAGPGDTPVYGLESLTGLRAGWHMLQYVWSSGGEVVRSYHPDASGALVEVPPPAIDYRRHRIHISDAARYDDHVARLRQRLHDRGVPVDYARSDLAWRLVVDDDAGAAVLEFHRRLTHAPWIRCANRHDDREYDVTPAMLERRIARCPVCALDVDLKSPKGRRRIYRGVVQIGQSTETERRAVFAMRVGTVQELSASAEGSLEVPMPFPSRTRDIPPAALIAGHYLAINATQKDPRVRDAAWQYIRFMTGPDAQRIRVDTYVEYGLEQFVRPNVLARLGYELEQSRIPESRRHLWTQFERTAHVEPYCQGFTNVMTRELSIPMEAIFADVPDSAGRYARDPRQLLSDTCRRVNTLVLGDLPADVVKRRSRIGWVIVGGGMLLLGVVLAVSRTKGRRPAARGRAGRSPRGGAATIVGFLAPAVGLTLLWNYYPLLRGTVMAFQDYRLLGGSTYVGLENFVETTGSPEFWRYVLQTLQYVLLSLAMGFVSPIVLAIVLTEIPRGRIVFRTLYYLPAVTTGIVTLFMWKQLFYDPAETGMLNRVILCFNDRPPVVMIAMKGLIVAIITLAVVGLARTGLRRSLSGRGRTLALGAAALGAGWLILRAAGLWTESGSITACLRWFAEPWSLHPQRFLFDRDLAMFWIVVPTIWAGLGPGCLIYLAALKSIPEEQYEAADIDGAGVWAKCTQVVIPNLAALILINLVGAVVGAMQASQNVFVMTGGGPEDATMTVGLSVWFNAYMFLNFGLATAQAWILGAMLIGFTIFQIRLLRRVQFRAAHSGTST